MLERNRRLSSMMLAITVVSAGTLTTSLQAQAAEKKGAKSKPAEKAAPKGKTNPEAFALLKEGIRLSGEGKGQEAEASSMRRLNFIPVMPEPMPIAPIFI